MYLSDGFRETPGLCPFCDKASTPASTIGMCAKCLRTCYQDAVKLIAAADPSGELRRWRDEHEASVAPGKAMGGKPGWVYFFRDGDRCKIGWTQDPATRAKALGHGLMIAMMPGYMADEKALHRRFDLLRLDGEWFAYTPALANYVSQIAAEAA